MLEFRILRFNYPGRNHGNLLLSLVDIFVALVKLENAFLAYFRYAAMVVEHGVNPRDGYWINLLLSYRRFSFS